ncbi:hypothetical protein C7999DRAFT_17669 [Corynascus novoguineensis]|uniref:Uncharacterized protein n=1 Tax=Corynascus novoguineensis TaxID=1126955 RepID=A0AAN7CKZ7_9PEZI|nr:hypothetical protein C7999DRAFT_17669 [Corynascus novoguineensis]
MAVNCLTNHRTHTIQAVATWDSASRSKLSVPSLTVPIDQDRQPSPSKFRGRLQSLRRATSPARSKSSQSPDGSKGALGLTLLHEPSEPRIDFVFVHGLNGGSRRSWSATSDPSTFWPKEWLPSEAGFRHVRIHTFGYDSDWTKSQQSTLTIHDFGQALLADLYNSPNLKRNGNVSIPVSHLPKAIGLNRMIDSHCSHCPQHGRLGCEEGELSPGCVTVADDLSSDMK